VDEFALSAIPTLDARGRFVTFEQDGQIFHRGDHHYDQGSHNADQEERFQKTEKKE
jgi:hypothetical protein